MLAMEQLNCSACICNCFCPENATSWTIMDLYEVLFKGVLMLGTIFTCYVAYRTYMGGAIRRHMELTECARQKIECDKTLRKEVSNSVRKSTVKRRGSSFSRSRRRSTPSRTVVSYETSL